MLRSSYFRFGFPLIFLAVTILLFIGASHLQSHIADDTPSAYVVFGENGAPVARLITTDIECPIIRFDTQEFRMDVRANGFGFMTMERKGSKQWEVKVWDSTGRVRNTCNIEGRHSICEMAQVEALSSPASQRSATQ